MPVALPDLAVTTPNTPVTLQPAANDQGVPPLTVIGFGAAAHGAVVLNADQTLTYTPAAGFIGTDSFTYTLTDAGGGVVTGSVSVIVNDLPVANDDQARTEAGVPVEIAVIANDSDADPLSIAAWGLAGHGDVEVLAGQTIRYVPQPGFAGSDSFTYTVIDPYGATAAATVGVTVDAANLPPTATDDAAVTPAGTPLVLDLLANDNDPDGDPLALVGLSVPVHGSLAVAPDQTVTYTPAAGFIGVDEFTYTASDGRGEQASAAVRITVERPNTAPVAAAVAATTQADTPVQLNLLAQASDADGDALQLTALTLPAHGQLTVNADHSVTYDPVAGFTGEDGFTYTVSDGRGGSASAEVRIEVEPPPAAPTYPNGYTARRRIVVPPRQAGSEPAAGFVALVSETGAWLRSQAHGGRIVSASGHDLRFELENGTKLAHEIELYDGSAGRLLAWVRIPSWNPAATQRFFLYLGKPGIAASEAEPALVWSDYLAVWDARTGIDRSGNGRHLTPGAVTAGELIGPAARFPGTTASTVAAAAFANGHAALSLQCWARAEAATVGSNRGLLQQGPRNDSDGDQGLLLRYAGSGFRGGGSNVVIWSVRTTAGVVRLESAAAAHGTSPRAFHAVWRSGELPRLYLDGVATVPSWAGAITATATAGQALSGTTQMAAGGLSLGAGSVAGNAGTWLGLADEVRLRATAPTPLWIASEHANQADPQGFYGIGAVDAPTEPAASVVAIPRLATTGAGSWIDTDVLASAYVPAGAPAPTVQAVSQPANGLATIIAGKVRYTPNAGFVGSDSFTYTLDSGGKRSTARLTVTVTVQAAEYPPPLRTVTVSSRTALVAALAGALPGDHIVLNDGTYTGSTVIFDKAIATTPTRPVVIRAASKLRAKLQFDLSLRVPHAMVWGLEFDACQLQLRASNTKALRCKFHDCPVQAIRVFGPTSGIEVGYCDLTTRPFEFGVPLRQGLHKRHCIATVEDSDADAAKNVRIFRNYFHDLSRKPTHAGFPDPGPDFPPSGYDSGFNGPILVGENGGSIGDSAFRWVVEDNLFARCLNSTPNATGGRADRVGGLETKASEQIFRRNTMIDCESFMTIRQGFGTRVEANWIENSGGIVIYSGGTGSGQADPGRPDNHVVIGNYVDRTAAGIRVMAGQDEGRTTAQFSSKGTMLVGNDSHLYVVGETFGSDFINPALDTAIHVCRKHANGEAFGVGVLITDANKASTIQLGLQQGTTISGVNASGFALPAAPVRLGTADVGTDAPWGG